MENINHNKILKQMIAKSFPELKNTRIIIIFKENLETSGAIKPSLRGGYILSLDKHRTKDYTKELLEGLFSHELSHILIANRRFLLVSGFVNLKVWFSRKALRKEERKVDLLAIKKGYGKQLQKQRKYAEENFQSELKDVYMKSEEISKLLK